MVRGGICLEKKVNKEKSNFIFKEQGPTLEELVIHITNNILLNKNEFNLDFRSNNDVRLNTKDN